LRARRIFVSVTEAISRESGISTNFVSVTEAISRQTAIFTNFVSVTEAISRQTAIFANLVSVTETVDAVHQQPGGQAEKSSCYFVCIPA